MRDLKKKTVEILDAGILYQMYDLRNTFFRDN
jgi:hypothetical protein